MAYELSDLVEIAGDPTQPRWVECKEVPGFAVLMRVPDVPGLRGLAQQAVFGAAKKMREQIAAGAIAPGAAEIDPGIINVNWLLYAIQDWRGLTRKALEHFFAETAVKLKEAKGEVDGNEIPFQADLCELLLRRSVRFFSFADQSWENLQSEALEALEEEDENLMNAPGSTLTPSDAPGAKAITKP